MNRYVVVGTGVAGIAAVEALRASERAAEITLVGDDSHGFYSRPGLAYTLTGEVPKKQLYILSDQDWRRLKVHYVNGRVTQLDPRSHRIKVNATGALTYDRLLLATGATAIQLDVPGARLEGVVKLDHFEDALHISTLARRNKTAVVVGGGIIAVELVEGLLAQGVRVHYFLRGARYWPNVLGEVESRMIEQRLAHHGVQLHYNTEIAEIVGRRGRITAVRTTRGELLRCGIVAVGIGVRARTELAQAAGLVTERGILVNEYLQTSDADIFAAGDAAQVSDPLTGQSFIDTLWHPAREKGRLAALNMTGQKQICHKTAATNVLRLAGIMISIMGAVGGGRDADVSNIARGSSETWQPVPNTLTLETGSEVNHLRLIVGEKTLLGALVMGEQSLSKPLQELILAQADITSIRVQLLESHALLGNLVLEYWTKWRLRAAQ